jgi:flagellar biosynthesis GTPase FlhF
MKFNVYLFLFITVILVSGCVPSPQEKEEIAVISCNIMAASRNMDGAIRIKQINEAREEMGEKKFLLSDEAIKESFEYGLCKELVLNNPKYNAMLSELKAIEQEALSIAREEREAKQKAEKIATEERTARQKAQTDALVEAGRIAYKKKMAKQKAERIEAQAKWRAALVVELEKVGYKPKLLSLFKHNKSFYSLNLSLSCIAIKGFNYRVKSIFHNNLGTRKDVVKGTCNQSQSTFISGNSMSDALLEELSKEPDEKYWKNLIKEMYIEIYSVDYFGLNAKFRRLLVPELFPPLKGDAILSNPIVYKVDISS